MDSISCDSGDLKQQVSMTPTALSNTEPVYNNWESFLELWERANLIRSFVWSQESADETALFTHFLVRMRRFFKIDFCFIALHQEDGKIMQAGVPEALLDQLPVDFVRRSMDVVANSRVPVAWKRLHAKTGFQTVVVSPLSPSVGQPLGFLMLGHSRARHFTKAELFLLQSLAGEVSWAVRELRSKHRHHKLLSAASLELKSSLNKVLGECTLLREAEGLVLTSDHGQKLTGIEKTIQETVRTISGFLDSMIAEEGRFAAAREKIDLVAVIEDTLLSCRDKAKEAGLELAVQYGGDLPREFWTDPVRFRHVLRNLADHAIEISRQGAVLISVWKNSEFVEFNVKVSEPQAVAGAEPRVESVARVRAGDFVYDRLEMIRENLKLLNGHLHFVKRPGEGFEISMCLA